MLNLIIKSKAKVCLEDFEYLTIVLTLSSGIKYLGMLWECFASKHANLQFWKMNMNHAY